MYSSLDVAAYIVSVAGETSCMKLQKMCYYAHGWSLVWRDEPLFNDEIRAWRSGAVIIPFYEFHKSKATLTPESFKGIALQELGGHEKVIVDTMIEAFRYVPSWDLAMSITGHDCWKKAYESESLVMDTDSIKETFEILDRELVSEGN